MLLDQHQDTLTRGKNTMLTISSIFSVILMARSWSCGIITPARKPPKMGCTPKQTTTCQTIQLWCMKYSKYLPMISVTNAEINTSNKVTAIKKGDGPCSNEPVLMASRRYRGATKMIKNIAKAAVVRNTYSASNPPEEFNRATTSARSTLCIHTLSVDE